MRPSRIVHADTETTYIKIYLSKEYILKYKTQGKSIQLRDAVQCLKCLFTFTTVHNSSSLFFSFLVVIWKTTTSNWPSAIKRIHFLWCIILKVWIFCNLFKESTKTLNRFQIKLGFNWLQTKGQVIPFVNNILFVENRVEKKYP